MSAFWNAFTTVVAALPPNRVKNWLLSRRPGFDVASDSRVGICLLRNVGALRVESGASIGFGNVFWNLVSVHVEARATVGHLNWISASPIFIVSSSPGIPVGAGTIVLGADSITLSRHRLDCSGGFYLGTWAILGGHGIEVLTHSLTIAEAAQVAAPVHIGDYSFVGSRVLILNDVDITDHVVIAAGSVVPKSLDKAYGFYVGVPAVWKTDVSPDITLFHRAPGFLGVREF